MQRLRLLHRRVASVGGRPLRLHPGCTALVFWRLGVVGPRDEDLEGRTVSLVVRSRVCTAARAPESVQTLRLREQLSPAREGQARPPSTPCRALPRSKPPFHQPGFLAGVEMVTEGNGSR